ncbi:beta/alpha barrel domain-containing protein [Candidatus Carsonella ruddii]|uniref:hypothetical protein n=1 Tax=Carsonella ruddii TaxID=114186 RepID=UPI00247ADBB0|nr:hypothetical protein [Candidatus Carsonella ruddii]WMC18358.1 MAG: hypothetical protein NU472_00535 [Candidatus Carsonella ruddii]WMC18552.1 MAG: hypothetical protein NU470_00535 [Candidatus Carsonella ruddii]WMC18745.1 MAG: hypothetical protein NU471_00535 [Candidatus Carsonella ruddii]WMC20151.1 MAG: hypothetical protein NVS90_00540 [Candidatus Carsonella ruddii]
MLSIKKNYIKNEILKIIFSNFFKFHIDIMDFSYVNNISFCVKEIKKIYFFLKKIKNILIEFHYMTKFIKKNKNKINHFENNIYKKTLFVIGNNFCWNYYFFFKKKILIMSVNPGFGNQKFLKKTKYIFFKKTNIDGGIKKEIFILIKNYFNKIIIGSDIIKKKKLKSYFNFNFIKNNYLI